MYNSSINYTSEKNSIILDRSTQINLKLWNEYVEIKINKFWNI